jgi:hypothetical protein
VKRRGRRGKPWNVRYKIACSCYNWSFWGSGKSLKGSGVEWDSSSKEVQKDDDEVFWLIEGMVGKYPSACRADYATFESTSKVLHFSLLRTLPTKWTNLEPFSR